MVKRILFLALPLATLVTVIGVSVGVILPWVQSILQNRRDLPSQQQTLQQLTHKLEVLAGEDEQQLRNYLLTLEVVIPSTPQPALTLAELEELAARNSLAVDSIQYAGSAKELVHAEVGLVGEYQPMTVFMQQLSQAAPLLRVSSFEVSYKPVGETVAQTSSSSNQAGLFGGVFEVNSPYAPILEELGAVEEPVQGLSPSEKELLQKAQKLQAVFAPPSQEEAGSAQPTPTIGREDPFAAQ